MAAEEARDSAGPLSRYEGILTDSAPLLAERFGERRAWPATWFNDFGKCPYYFFARHVMKLELAEDPEPGLDARVRGSLIHGVLERLYGSMAAAGLNPCAEHEGALLEALDGACAEEFRGAPERMAFRPTPLWRWEQAEMLRCLQRYIRWECTDAGGGEWRPWRQEVSFGYGPGALPRARIGDEEQGFWLAGRIDRIDRDASGRLRVVDYKTGSTPVTGRDIEEGRAVQVALYSLAVANLFEMDPAGVLGLYAMVDSRTHTGRIDGDDKGAALREAAVAHALGAIASARNGWFAVAPSQPYAWGQLCRQSCDFGPLCRVNHAAIVKARGSVLDMSEEEA